MTRFAPRLDILPPAQRRLWDALSAVPPEFVLYGGTAIALHLGHRRSVDFDFFGEEGFDRAVLQARVHFLADATVVRAERNTLVVTIGRDEPINVSFFGVPRLPRLAPCHVAPDNGLRVASLLDLAGTKASVVQLRAEAKDYLDLDALVLAGVDLSAALAAGRAIYGNAFNPEVTLKALAYFEDGNLASVPDEVKRRLADAVLAVDIDKLPSFEPIRWAP
ncbi:MAG: nucleotidyl transferase AbiEii/AbiGii toxin family protein [Alphaproteobacteria bacterium]|nr:nucleotidyl transferase AbiEii/AbiGii toxin family protein [Alphaproteobacteria bacterium]